MRGAYTRHVECVMEEGMKKFGDGDTSYLAAGKQTGIRRLVDRFYDIMATDRRFRIIREMHAQDDTVSRDKLALFLCGWLGGPHLYRQKYGQIIIPAVHAHLDIGDSERDQWLSCMREAIEAQPYKREFKDYLCEQLTFPASAIRARSGAEKKTGPSFPVGSTTNTQ